MPVNLDSRFIGSRSFYLIWYVFLIHKKKLTMILILIHLFFDYFHIAHAFGFRSEYNFITKILCAIYFLLSKARFRPIVWLEVLQCVLAVVLFFFFFFFPQWQAKWFRFSPYFVFSVFTLSRNVYILFSLFSVMFLVSIDVDACHRFQTI